MSSRGDGSGNVFINGIPAARAHVDVVNCSRHSPPYPPIATGSATAYINGQPAARVHDKAGCSAVISAGSHNVFIGGGTVQTDVLEPENLVPDGVHAALLVAGVGSAIVLGGPIIATAGLIGGVAGQLGGEWLGGKAFGIGSDGQKWTMLGGSLFGGVAGAKGTAGLAGRSMSQPLLMTLGEVEGKLYGANGVVELSPGALLRHKHGHLTAGERQAIIFGRTEEIARQQLLAKAGGHFMERHAPDIPLRDQLVSAATGRRPDGKIMMKGSNPNKKFAVDSTQFYTYKDMLYGINRAERIQQHAISMGQPVNGYISLKYSDFVGGGFVKNSPLFGASDLSRFYGKTPYANLGVDPVTGRAITAYPVLSKDGLGTLY